MDMWTDGRRRSVEPVHMRMNSSESNLSGELPAQKLSRLPLLRIFVAGREIYSFLTKLSLSCLFIQQCPAVVLTDWSSWFTAVLYMYSPVLLFQQSANPVLPIVTALIFICLSLADREAGNNLLVWQLDRIVISNILCLINWPHRGCLCVTRSSLSGTRRTASPVAYARCSCLPFYCCQTSGTGKCIST